MLTRACCTLCAPQRYISIVGAIYTVKPAQRLAARFRWRNAAVHRHSHVAPAARGWAVFISVLQQSSCKFFQRSCVGGYGYRNAENGVVACLHAPPPPGDRDAQSYMRRV